MTYKYYTASDRKSDALRTANMMRSIGHRAKVVSVPGYYGTSYHVYVDKKKTKKRKR